MTVYLVGAGPGDPGLLTRRGAELLAQADVVVHDRLVDPALLALVRDGAELIDAGKRPGEDAGRAQEEINTLLVARARSGEVVVRLKGGDPYVFGRGGEEALALDAAGVTYEVIPGVSAALAAPALAGVPVTHRGFASAVTVVTGHEAGDGEAAVDWDRLARSGATLVVLMAVERRAWVADRLIAAGMEPETPVTVIERASTVAQRSQRMTLAELGAASVSSPATVVVGAVAGMRLAGLEDRPLFGRRIVVTRAREQASELVRVLSGLGARVVECPTIAVGDPPDGGAALRGALSDLGRYSWVVFTSVNAVERCFAVLRDARSLSGTRVAAVGSATAAALRCRGVVADLVPELARAEGLLARFPDPEPDSRWVLLPRAVSGSAVLVDGLAERGYRVDVVPAYETLQPVVDEAVLAAVAEADAVTFASGSAVAGLLALAGPARMPPVVATIGPVTSAAVREAGLHVTVEAKAATAVALAEALATYFAGLSCVHG